MKWKQLVWNKLFQYSINAHLHYFPVVCTWKDPKKDRKKKRNERRQTEKKNERTKERKQKRKEKKRKKERGTPQNNNNNNKETRSKEKKRKQDMKNTSQRRWSPSPWKNYMLVTTSVRQGTGTSQHLLQKYIDWLEHRLGDTPTTLKTVFTLSKKHILDPISAQATVSRITREGGRIPSARGLKLLFIFSFLIAALLRRCVIAVFQLC